MKKIIYLICSGLIAFSSCDPMEDVYQELDAQKDAGLYNKDMVLTMTPANYQSLKGKPGAPSNIDKTLYFTSETEAAALIPLYLSASFPQLDNGSSAKVTFNQLVFDFTNNTVADSVAALPIYVLTNQDYTDAGSTRTSFNISNNDNEVRLFLKNRYTDAPVPNQLAVITFNAFNSRVSSASPATTFSYYYKNGKWEKAYHVTEADYISVNRGRYKNFEGIDNDLLPVYFNKFLSNAFLNPQVGEVQYVSYNYFSSGKNTQRILTMSYNGSAWVEVKQDITKPATLTFAKKDGKWAPDLTVKLAFAEADYLWIADQDGIGTALNRANLKSFKNFYQQTQDDRYWSDAQIRAGLAARLKNLYPNAEVGQKYQVSYVIYNSGAQTRVVTFIKDASGNYVVFNG